jgi:membrane protein implicated in regulation of membrane protease activity
MKREFKTTHFEDESMNASTFWWMATGALVIAELLTGTFYLLMLSLGAAAAALAAHAGLGMTAQVITAALVGGAGVVLWNLKSKHQPAGADAADTHIHLDIGTTVNVDAWDEQGLTHVKHRGAMWAASCQNSAHTPGLHTIVAIEGSRLVLEKI